MENLITIPIGCVGFCDTACEAAIDTVLFPVDYVLVSHRDSMREKKLNELDERRERFCPVSCK